MPNLNLKINHQLPANEATSRIRNLLKQTQRKFGDKISGLKENWTGNSCEFSFKAMGFAIAGTLIVKRNEVHLKGTLPWTALPFKAKIESAIRERAAKLLS